MVYKEKDVCDWFQKLCSWKKIDLLCHFLRMCHPLELRYMGSFVEQLAKRDFLALRDMELKVNDSNELRRNISTDNSSEALSKLIVALSLLHSTNRASAHIVFNILSLVVKQTLLPKAGFDTESCYSEADHGFDVNNTGVSAQEMGVASEATLEDLLLSITLAVHHPAITFSECLHLQKWRKAIMALIQKRNKDVEAKSEVDVKRQAHVKNIQLVESDDKQLTEGKAHYALQVSWSDGDVTTTHKTLQEVLNFQHELVKRFPEDAGVSREKRQLPLFATCKDRKRVNNKDIEHSLEKYFSQLSVTPPHIIQCDTVMNFCGRQDAAVTDNSSRLLGPNMSSTGLSVSSEGENQEPEVISSYTFYNSNFKEGAAFVSAPSMQLDSTIPKVASSQSLPSHGSQKQSLSHTARTSSNGNLSNGPLVNGQVAGVTSDSKEVKVTSRSMSPVLGQGQGVVQSGPKSKSKLGRRKSHHDNKSGSSSASGSVYSSPLISPQPTDTVHGSHGPVNGLSSTTELGDTPVNGLVDASKLAADQQLPAYVTQQLGSEAAPLPMGTVMYIDHLGQPVMALPGASLVFMPSAYSIPDDPQMLAESIAKSAGSRDSMQQPDFGVYQFVTGADALPIHNGGILLPASSTAEVDATETGTSSDSKVSPTQSITTTAAQQEGEYGNGKSTSNTQSSSPDLSALPTGSVMSSSVHGMGQVPLPPPPPTSGAIPPSLASTSVPPPPLPTFPYVQPPYASRYPAPMSQQFRNGMPYQATYASHGQYAQHAPFFPMGPGAYYSPQPTPFYGSQALANGVTDPMMGHHGYVSHMFKGPHGYVMGLQPMLRHSGPIYPHQLLQQQHVMSGGGRWVGQLQVASCYNCGATDHAGADCPDNTMEATTAQGSFRLNYQVKDETES